LGGMPAQPILGAPDGVSFRLVKDTLVVGLLCAQQMEENASKLVGRGCNRLGPAEFAGDTAEEFTEIVFGVM
jgi:hypothetical protein